jgi:hypothetical protein
MGGGGFRCVAVDHTTLYRWTQRYPPELEKSSAWYRSRPILRSSSPRSPRSRSRLVAILGLSSQGGDQAKAYIAALTEVGAEGGPFRKPRVLLCTVTV